MNFAERNEKCDLCELHKFAKHICIFGEGPKNADVMGVGLGPGSTENKYGHPFIGRAGKLLDKILAFIQLDRKKIYISNVIKCKPPGNKPSSKEIKTCIQYLKEEIKTVKPKVIFAMGEVACNALINKKKMGPIIGKIYPLVWDSSIPVVPCIHPAALLYKGAANKDPQADSDGTLKLFTKGFLTLKRFLKGELINQSDYGEYNISPTLKEALYAITEAMVKKLYTLDFETNGLDPFKHNAKIKCASITTEERKSVVIPWEKEYWGEGWPRIVIAMRKLLLDPTVTLNAHNTDFEYRWSVKHILQGKQVKNQLSDTMLMHYLLWDYKPHALKNLAWEASQCGGYEEESEKAGGIENVDGEIAYRKCAIDTDLSHRFRNIFMPQMIDDGVYKAYDKLLIPATPVLAEMEYKGVPADRTYLEHLDALAVERSEEFTNQLLALRPMKNFMKKTKRASFNPRSPVQMRELAKYLGIKVFKTSKKTRQPSVDKEVLEFYGPKYPVLDKILNIKELKSLSSYIRKQYIPSISDDGRIHTSYNLAVARSGRLASSSPNLQNVFKEIAEKWEDLNVRNFIYADEGYSILSVDASLHELRVLAAICKDPVMIKILNRGSDLHGYTGAQILGITFEEFEKRYNAAKKGLVDDSEIMIARMEGKTINFAVVYGIGPIRLSRQLRVSMAEGKRFLKVHAETYARFTEWKKEAEKFIKDNKFILLATGRKRRWPIVNDNVLRQGVNSYVQGPASDLILKALIRIAAFLKKNKCKSFPVLTVHDEIDLFEHETEKDQLIPYIEEIIVNPEDSDWLGNVKLAVDFSRGDRWGDLKEI